MEVTPRQVEYYRTADGQAPYREWYRGLTDMKAKAAIAERLTRVERGLLGDYKPLGDGIFELKVDTGPGYRVYFGQEGRILVWLLSGGDKKTQNKDIKTAKLYWSDYLRRRQS